MLAQLEPKTRLYYEDFYRCDACGKVYWDGSHVDDMKRRFVGFFGHQGGGDTA